MLEYWHVWTGTITQTSKPEDEINPIETRIFSYPRECTGITCQGDRYQRSGASVGFEAGLPSHDSDVKNALMPVASATVMLAE
jgi:hypothetical protein